MAEPVPATTHALLARDVDRAVGLAVSEPIAEGKLTDVVGAPRLRTLARVNRLISSSLDMDAVLRGIARAAAELMAAPIVTFWIADEAARTLTARAFSDDEVGADFPVSHVGFDQGGVGWVAAHRRPLDVPDVFADGRLRGLDWWRAHGLSSFYAVPVILGDSLLAVLVLNAREPFRLGPDDLEILDSFVAQAATAIRNARLHAETEARRRAAESLAEVVRLISQSLDPHEVVQRIADSVRALLGTRNAVFLRLEPESGGLVVLALSGGFGPALGPDTVLPKHTGAAGMAVHERRPFATPNLLTDPRIPLTPELRARIEQAPHRAVLAVPLHTPDGVIGALSVGDRADRVFTDEEVRLAQAFADHAGVMLQNAQLFAREQGARAKAEASEQRFRDLVQDLDAVVWEADAKTLLFSFISQPVEAMLGYPVERWLTEPDFWANHIHPDDREQTVALCVTASAEARDHEFEYRMVAADGRVAWLHDTVHVVHDPEGRARQLRGVMVDITGRKRAEEAFRESEARFRAAFEHSGIGMALQATEGRYLRVNKAYCDLLGYSESELLAMTFQALTHPDDVARDIASDRQMLSGEIRSYQLEKRYVHKLGHTIPALVSVSLVPNGDGTPAYFVVQVQDIAMRKHLEDELRQAQKMEAVGRLAGGVAHDFNNLLTVIGGRSHLLLRRLGPEDPLARHADLIEKTAARAAALTHQLLAFSRKQMLQPKVLDLDAVVASVKTMLRRLIGEDIELSVVSSPMLGRVRADPAQLEQVILNLAVNARDAMPQGGRLTLETADVELDEAFVRRQPGISPGPYVMLAVRDTGVGMNADTQAHLFEPFFTTKGPGKGTGLGLATVYGIVSQSGGHIEVESKLGRGTTFRIYLPRAEEAAQVLGPSPVAAGPPRGSETVLLVEDEEDLRDLAREVLQMHGYTVLEAGHGNEALLVAGQHRGAIRLLVTDVVMPKMSGREVADRLTSAHPEMRVLYMSGYTEDATGLHGVLERGTAFLRKPFTPDVLAQKVREVLDSPRTA